MLVDFWADLVPALPAARPDASRPWPPTTQGRLTVAKVDVDASPELAQRYGIQSIPTLILFRGGRVVDKRLGALPKDDLRRFVDAQTVRPPRPRSHDPGRGARA